MYVYATAKSKELPAVSIGDNSVESFGWNWQDGWGGLVPSCSRLADAKSLLGEASGVSELANGLTYDFLSGKVRVTILDDSEYIVRIWIDCLAAPPFQLPANAEEASKILGKLITTGVSRLDGAILERPGMRICCNAMDENNPILWMEIYKPIQ